MAMNRKIKRCYIAGPYTSDTYEQVESNIQAALAVGVIAARMGYYPVIPHANTPHFELVTSHPVEWWYEATADLLRVCDAIMMVPGWEKSTGAVAEFVLAKALGLKVLFPDGIEKWCEDQGDDDVCLEGGVNADDCTHLASGGCWKNCDKGLLNLTRKIRKGEGK